jgi:cell division protein ZapA
MNPTAERKTVRVTIFNQTYALASTGGDDVEALAHSVDDLMHDIAQRSGVGDATRVAVLTALHLADRLHGLENELASLKERVDRKSREFALLLDKSLDKSLDQAAE